MDVVIIGCGKIAGGYDAGPQSPGIRTHVRAYQNRSDTRLVAVCDSDPVRARNFARKWKVPRCYHDIGLMLKETQPQLVSICVPAPAQETVVKSCLSSKSIRGLWCEKPFGITQTQALRMAGSIRGERIALVVNHQRQNEPGHRQLGQKIRNGKLGEIQQVLAFYTNGVLCNATHWLQLFASWFGPADDVKLLRVHGPRAQSDPTVDAFLRFGKIPIHLLGLEGKHYSEFSLQIWGSKGFVGINRYGLSIEEKRVLSDPDFPGSFQLEEQPAQSATQLNDAMQHTLEHLVKLATRRRWDEAGVASAVEAVRIAENLKKQAHR